MWVSFSLRVQNHLYLAECPSHITCYSWSLSLFIFIWSPHICEDFLIRWHRPFIQMDSGTQRCGCRIITTLHAALCCLISQKCGRRKRWDVLIIDLLYYLGTNCTWPLTQVWGEWYFRLLLCRLNILINTNVNILRVNVIVATGTLWVRSSAPISQRVMLK